MGGNGATFGQGSVPSLGGALSNFKANQINQDKSARKSVLSSAASDRPNMEDGDNN